MDLGLNGRHALVTGASKGIGLATARLLAAEGCRVTMVARDPATLDAAAASIGDAARALPGDLSQAAEVDRIWAAAGTPDILVNNAGSVPSGGIDDVDDERWRAAWDLKLFGYINLARHALPAMKARGSGVIVNVIGAAGERPQPGYLVGAGGNAALMAITRALGSTSLADGVRVVGINPGLIATERLETLLRAQATKRYGDADRWRDLLDGRYPPGRPEHVAALVAFLASDRSGNTSGTIVTVDGGASAR